MHTSPELLHPQKELGAIRLECVNTLYLFTASERVTIDSPWARKTLYFLHPQNELGATKANVLMFILAGRIYKLCKLYE